MNKAWACWALLALSASPALVPLFLILDHSVNMPYWDHWNPFTAGLYIKAHQGQVTLHDLLALQNEHRPVVPRLIYLSLNVFTHWNTTVECLLEWCFVCVVSGSLLWLFRLTERERAPRAPLGPLATRALGLWFVCNLLLFSPAQWENWLFGMGLVNITPMTCITPALVVIAAQLRPWPTVIAAMLLSTAATYSNGCGLFFWPLIAILLAWSSSREALRGKRGILLTYGAWAVVNIALYFVGYARPTHGGAALYTASPAKITAYTLAFLGNLFAFTTELDPSTIAMVAGAVMLALLLASMAYFLFAWRQAGDHDLCRRMLFWLVVGWTSVLNACLSSFARAGAGTQVATSSRYVTFALFLPVALVFLIPIVCEDARRRSWSATMPWVPRLSIQAPAVLGTAVVLMALAAIPGALAASRATEGQRRQGKAALLLLNVLPDDPHLTSNVCAEIDLIRRQAPLLDEMGYLHPRLIAGPDAAKIQADPDTVGGVRGGLEQLGRAEADRIRASGWAVFPTRSQPVDAVFLTYDDAQGRPIIFALADMGRPRHDIVRMEGTTDVLASGWVAVFPRSRLPASMARTTVSAWALDTDTGKAYKLGGGKTVEL